MYREKGVEDESRGEGKKEGEKKGKLLQKGKKRYHGYS